MKQEMTGWQWHQLDHMQIICTSLQTNTPPLNFYWLYALPATPPTVSKYWRHLLLLLQNIKPNTVNVWQAAVNKWYSDVWREIGSEPTESEVRRCWNKESSSSKNITQGALSAARWNTCLTARSLSPTYCTAYQLSVFLSEHSWFTIRQQQITEHIHKVEAFIRCSIRANFSTPDPDYEFQELCNEAVQRDFRVTIPCTRTAVATRSLTELWF